MSLPSSMADFVPCDRLLQKAYWAIRLKSFIKSGKNVHSLCHAYFDSASKLSPRKKSKSEKHESHAPLGHSYSLGKSQPLQFFSFLEL